MKASSGDQNQRMRQSKYCHTTAIYCSVGWNRSPPNPRPNSAARTNAQVNLETEQGSLPIAPAKWCFIPNILHAKFSHFKPQRHEPLLNTIFALPVQGFLADPRELDEFVIRRPWHVSCFALLIDILPVVLSISASCTCFSGHGRP